MRNSVVFPVMGVLTVISAAIGLQLGESAIAQIDPIHFSGPPPAVRDVTRDPRPQPAATYAAAYGWAEGHETRNRECSDCAAPDAGSTHAMSEPAAAVQADPWRGPVTYERAAYEAPPADAPQWREVSRYANYPVTQEQAERAESLAAAARSPVPAPAEEAEASEPAGL